MGRVIQSLLSPLILKLQVRIFVVVIGVSIRVIPVVFVRTKGNNLVLKLSPCSKCKLFLFG